MIAMLYGEISISMISDNSAAAVYLLRRCRIYVLHYMVIMLHYIIVLLVLYLFKLDFNR